MIRFHKHVDWWLELKAVWRLAVPVASAQIGMMALGVEDAIMVGRVSAQALAAVALGHLYTMGLMVLGHGVLLALDPLVAQAHGANDRPAIEIAFQRGLFVATLLSIPFCAAFLVAAPVLRAFGQPADVVPIAAQYAAALAPSVPAFFVFVVLRQTLQAQGITRPTVIAVVLGNVSNLALNWVLVYGHAGAPAMGAVGSAWSTTITRFAMMFGLTVAAWPALPPFASNPLARICAWQPIARLLAIGIPIGVQIGLEVWVFMATGLLVGTMGTDSLSGHQIALNLASLSFMAPLGIGAAAATRVGQAIGRKDQAGARRAAFVSIALGAFVMTVSAIVFAAFPRQLALVYTHDDAVIDVAVTLLPIAAIFQVFDGTQAVACGVLRGAADTRVAAIINLIGYWVLALPIGALLAFGLGWKAPGLWWGLTLGLASVAVALVLRIRHWFAL